MSWIKINPKVAAMALGLFLLCSCKAVVKTFYGIKKPKFETENSLTTFLQKKKAIYRKCLYG